MSALKTNVLRDEHDRPFFALSCDPQTGLASLWDSEESSLSAQEHETATRLFLTEEQMGLLQAAGLFLNCPEEAR